jgi:hypothetical protein
MSEIADTQSGTTTRRDDERADKRAFAQVEKWMAMIREIDAERQARTKRDGCGAVVPDYGGEASPESITTV